MSASRLRTFDISLAYSDERASYDRDPIIVGLKEKLPANEMQVGVISRHPIYNSEDAAGK